MPGRGGAGKEARCITTRHAVAGKGDSGLELLLQRVGAQHLIQSVVGAMGQCGKVGVVQSNAVPDGAGGTRRCRTGQRGPVTA